MFIRWLIFTFKENLLLSVWLFLYWCDIKVIITKYILWYSLEVYSVLVCGDQSSLCYLLFGNSYYYRKSRVLPFDRLPTEKIYILYPVFDKQKFLRLQVTSCFFGVCFFGNTFTYFVFVGNEIWSLVSKLKDATWCSSGSQLLHIVLTFSDRQSFFTKLAVRLIQSISHNVCWMSDICLSPWCNLLLERDGDF